MSTEANTFEKISINNINAKTKAFAEAFGTYLLEMWGVNSLTLNVDGREYQSETYIVADDAELAEACRKLGEAKNITAAIRSSNNDDFAWRLEAGYLSLLSDDEELKNNISYKSTDYYDQDSCVDLFSFGKNGAETLACDQPEMTFSDVQIWYSYTPEISFSCLDGFSENVVNTINAILLSLATEYFERGEDSVYTDKRELFIDGSISFKTADIPVIANKLQQAVDAVKGTIGAKCEIDINAVPDGEDDYDFASVHFGLEDGRVRVGYCRF